MRKDAQLARTPQEGGERHVKQSWPSKITAVGLSQAGLDQPTYSLPLDINERHAYYYMPPRHLSLVVTPCIVLRVDH